MTVHAVPKTLDSIKKSLVALKMARALEVLDATLRKIEQGEINSMRNFLMTCPWSRPIASSCSS
jgi:hypothetical protein